MGGLPRAGSEADIDAVRRALMRQAACVAAGVASGAVQPVSAAPGDAPQRYARCLLVEQNGEPLRASRLTPGAPMLFNYPFVASPVFLLRLERAVQGAALMTEGQQAYRAPAGVGSQRNVVAFSAICAHKLMYPTPQISFIGVRKGKASEPAQVIHCCGDDSRYDPAEGARVIAGPAPQPLAAVLLEWDAQSDRLHAVGVQGGDRFEAFFDKYGFRLETELGARARALAGPTALVQAAAAYSRQWQSCRV